MTARVTFHDASDAESLAQLLSTAGYDAGVEREHASEDNPEDFVHVVHSNAPPEEINELVEDLDAVVEVKDPTTGAVARIDPE